MMLFLTRATYCCVFFSSFLRTLERHMEAEPRASWLASKLEEKKRWKRHRSGECNLKRVGS